VVDSTSPYVQWIEEIVIDFTIWKMLYF
jgi:hypothetical protein